jgi:hypothetical protein
MTESTKDNLKHIGVGVFLIAVLGIVVVVGLLVSGTIGATDEPEFDPVAAYCRGLSDGWVHAREANRGPLEAAGIPIITDTPEQITEFEALCAETVLTGDLRDYLQGPLFMPEDES